MEYTHNVQKVRENRKNLAVHNIDKEGYLLLWELRYRIQIRSIKLVPLPITQLGASPILS